MIFRILKLYWNRIWVCSYMGHRIIERIHLFEDAHTPSGVYSGMKVRRCFKCGKIFSVERMVKDV